jgi:predicted nucleotide-binding protein
MVPDDPSSPFARRTILMAADILTRIGHAGFDRMLLEFGLDDLRAGRELGGLTARGNALAKYAFDNPERKTAEGHSIGEAVVRRAAHELGRLGYQEPGTKEAEFLEAVTKHPSTTEEHLPEPTESSFVTVRDRDILSAVRDEQEKPTLHPILRTSKRRVFIVHGREEGPREAVARFLERIGFEVVILHEQVNKGRTLIEKFEEFGDVGYVVVLLTPDDVGAKAGETPHPRARQNVLLEWGYFIGHLGRSRVCALLKGDIELPSDIVGIVWEPFDDLGHWQRKLAKELEDAGFAIDWKTAMRS